MADKITPMMRQYLEMKEKHRDSILLYRLGDFYEMFFEDAILASKELDITLTGRDCGQDERAPMCGVPYHSVDGYISRLVSRGFKVSICEQIKDTETNEVTKREVVRTITPGTVTDPSMLDEAKNRYIMSIFEKNEMCSLCAADISTGEVFFTENYNISDPRMMSELSRFSPNELYTTKNVSESEIVFAYIKSTPSCISSICSDDSDTNYNEIAARHINEINSEITITDRLCIENFGFLLNYLHKTQLCELKHLNKISFIENSRYLEIDAASWRNLEITENMRTKELRGSLLGVLDKTQTAMGARYMRKSLERPFDDITEILKRLSAVNDLFNEPTKRDKIRNTLKNVKDIERLTTKLVYGTINPRDLLLLASSISATSELKSHLAEFSSALLIKIKTDICDLSYVRNLILNAICEEPPILTREGGFIKAGFNEEVDRLSALKTDATSVIAEIEAKEREASGIKSLKIKYNKVFGYYIEITNSFKDQVPDYYIRKQTLVNAERFITPELKKVEEDLFSASDKLIFLENDIYRQILEEIGNFINKIKQTSNAVALLDMIASFAEVSSKNGYVRPEIDLGEEINIRNGRHPVVESLLKSELFVPNNTFLNTSSDRMAVITGPNMAGKSTYMRQVALIVLMAQVGCFVPAYSAKIGLVDKIFTRVGASDDLASGQSTFMLEMNEVAYIVKNATKRSLLIFDEIGRGTSTFDGMSIAQAVLEFVAKKIKAKALFATHYHELTSLESSVEGVKNYNIAAKKHGKQIIFLRKIVEGGTDDSYGIDVARLAGVPEEIIKRAEIILSELEQNKKTEKPVFNTKNESTQLTITTPIQDEIIETLKKFDATVLTPLEALNSLHKLSLKAKGL